MTSVASYPHSHFFRPKFGRSTTHMHGHPRSPEGDLPVDDDDQRTPSELRLRAALRTEESSLARARAYVDDFLRKSPWSDQLDQITVRWDLIPTMEELEGYGDLDKTEGIRSCRRLFKAPVVWDDLGLGLWERLRTTSEQKKAALKGLGPMLRMGHVGDARPAVDGRPAQPDVMPERRGSEQSSASVSSRHSRMSGQSLNEARAAIPRIIRSLLGKS